MEEENIIKFPDEIKENFYKKWENPMILPKISKVTINMSIGEGGVPLEKASQVLESLVSQNPVKLKAKKTIRTFGIRKFEPIAIKTTLRGEKAINFLKRSLEVVENKLKKSSFDNYGNFSFGVKEHIELPGVKYDPKLGIFGFDVNVSLERLGFRIRRRSYRRKKIPTKIRLSPEEAMVFMEKYFGTTIIKEYIVSYY
ncbi:MAG: 50S ribosomal protein L5 [Candidatus Hodarchaeota archaeon]